MERSVQNRRSDFELPKGRPVGRKPGMVCVIREHIAGIKGI